MKTFVLSLFMVWSIFTHAQKTEIEEYCSIEMSPTFYGSKKGLLIAVDYGTAKAGEYNKVYLKDNDGKELLFFSTMQVVNHMAKDDWSLVNVFPSSSDQFSAFGKTTINTERSLFIFKRKRSKKDV